MNPRSESPATPDSGPRCPQCGGIVDCGMQAGRSTCWCFDLPHALPPPSDASAACLCEECLRKRIDEAAAPGPVR